MSHRIDPIDELPRGWDFPTSYSSHSFHLSLSLSLCLTFSTALAIFHSLSLFPLFLISFVLLCLLSRYHFIRKQNFCKYPTSQNIHASLSMTIPVSHVRFCLSQFLLVNLCYDHFSIEIVVDKLIQRKQNMFFILITDWHAGSLWPGRLFHLNYGFFLN